MSRPQPLPEYRITSSKLPGAPYSVSALYVGDTLVYSCLGVIDDPEQRIRQYLNPEPDRGLTEFEFGRRKKPPGRPSKVESEARRNRESEEE